MKKLYVLLFAFLTAMPLSAQVVFSEDFDGIGGATAGGAGTYSFPAGWLKMNVDNRTPDAGVSYVNEAWERREDFSFNVTDSCAFSTSWYIPTGAADDWMWTPAMTLPANADLSWNAVTYDASFPDGYEVRIMVAPNTPTGGPNNLGNMVSSSTQIFSIAAENTTWTSHIVNLAAYAGQTVRIAFRNTSNDKFLLLIDDVVVQQQIVADPELLSFTRPSDYFRIPLQQQPSYPLEAVIRNNGAGSITNTMLTANVYDNSNTLVYTSSSAASTLGAGASATFTASPFIPAATGTYRIEWNALASVDNISSNNLKIDSIIVTDSTYSRDKGNVTGALGIGAGNGGYVGQHFVLTQPAELTSVDIFLATPVNNMHMGMAIFPMVNGFPGSTPLYTAPVIPIPNTTPGWYHFQVPSGTLILPADTVVVEAVEVDSVLSVGLTNNIFVSNTTWVDWPTNPFTPWGNNEDYGAAYNKPYMIRPNFASPCASLSSQESTTSASCGTCGDGAASVSVSAGSPGYSYAWAPSGGNASSISGVNPGSYTVTITDQMGCVLLDTIQVGNTCANYFVAVDSVDASCGSCNDGSATITITNGLAPYTILWSNGDTSMVSDSLLPGVYTVTVTDASGCSVTDTVGVNFSTAIGNSTLNNGISAFPNPSDGTFMLQVSFAKATDGQIEIFDMLGARVFEARLEGVINRQVPVELGNQVSGHYIVRMTTASGLYFLPVIIR